MIQEVNVNSISSATKDTPEKCGKKIIEYISIINKSIVSKQHL